MNRKTSVVIISALLFVAFGIISVLVVVTKRHPWLVRKKLQLGALLLSLSAVTSGCRGGGPEVMCYDPVPDTMFVMDQVNSQSGSITLNKTVSLTLTGRIDFRNGTEFSCALLDTDGGIVEAHDIVPGDGIWDESSEAFSVALRESIGTGRYQLRFYDLPAASVQEADGHLYSFDIDIVE